MSDGSLLMRKPAVKIFDTKMQLGSKWQNFYEVSNDNFKIQAISQASVVMHLSELRSQHASHVEVKLKRLNEKKTCPLGQVSNAFSSAERD